MLLFLERSSLETKVFLDLFGLPGLYLQTLFETAQSSCLFFFPSLVIAIELSKNSFIMLQQF